MYTRFHCIFLAFVSLATAQNSRLPMKVGFVCAEEDLAAVGMACSDEEPCPVYLEVSGVSAAGKKLSLVGNLHGASNTLYSVLLVSDDSGATWKEQADRVPGAALEQVQWLESTHGWAAGETQVPLSRDPFVFITSDGGASWHRKLLTEDGTPGSVQRFWFDTADHGELVVEAGQYTLYETHNGGENWNIVSKTAQLPRLRRAPSVDDADYRIGSDSKARAYIVEKREGKAWTRVASFLVQVASCGTRHLPPVAEPEPAHSPEGTADAK